MPARAPPAMRDLKSLTDEEVSALFEDRIMERGIKYFEQGRIMRPFVYRESIMAECQGTLPENYYIRVDVRGGNLVASCTCPYALGYCKHIAAVLYGWLKKPGMFKDLGQSEDLLKKMDKGPLVETIIDMIKYDPDVVYVINLRLLPRNELPGFVEREMKNIFSEEFVDYLNVREIVKKLDIFREYASDIYQGGDIGTATVILNPVIDAIVDNYTNLDDTDGLMRNFFATVMDLYGDVIPNFRMEGERRRYMNQALEWYLLAEWGLERVLRNLIRKETERLKEQKFMLNAVELRLADFKKSFITMGPKYSEEYEYVEERLERLEEMRADIKGHA
ncbi:MAG TPA: SWIM zinc finger family protein [Methanocella sp.]|uniref:SWIM zinc finger family protein n=1 Tax=Methanocella sp. TaxID=2052833 RepID=UPI002B745A72|nr:SWIM zinc finger family protein [Methanocella sp.]HTY90738.1 SWIM zinc finger family protein [Methanocella sp.]